MHMGEGLRTSLGTRAGSAATQAWLISAFKSTTIFPAGRYFFLTIFTIFSLGFAAPREEDRVDGSNPIWVQEDGGGVPQVTGD